MTTTAIYVQMIGDVLVALIVCGSVLVVADVIGRAVYRWRERRRRRAELIAHIRRWSAGSMREAALRLDALAGVLSTSAELLAETARLLDLVRERERAEVYRWEDDGGAT